MRITLLLALGSLMLAAPAFARNYYYNPSFPNQPGSYNHHVQSSYHTALHSVAVTTLRDPNGNTWSGSPNGGAPGAKVVERSYRGLEQIELSRLNVEVARKLGVSQSSVFIQTNSRTVRRPGSILGSALDVSYRVMGRNNTIADSGKLLLVQLKNNQGSRLFKVR